MVHPSRILPEQTPADVGIEQWRDVRFESKDGLTLSGWYVETQNSATIILVHGIGGNRAQLLDDAALLVANDYGVLLFDLRNSGHSEGDLTTLGYLEALDVGGALDFLSAQPECSAEHVGLLGHSMGGATAILAAARYPQIKAVIAQSTFTSVEDNIGDSLKALTGLPPFPFAPLVAWFGEREADIDMGQISPLDAIGAISPRAVMIVHGELDEVISAQNAPRLYAAAGEPKDLYVIPGAGHGGLPQTQPEEYERHIVGFFDRYLLEE
ncbi:MAG: alpha/beta fold hydrolase [Chloroflexi bacterium]|nr:alpha/beta fold hydrolase [Chloroflexota bacterium]